jgi:hypothetical protein
LLSKHVLETADKFCEIGGCLCFKRERLAANGMPEGKGAGMQCQPAVRRIRSAIPLIAHHRVAPIRQMDADLVLPARQQFHVQ